MNQHIIIGNLTRDPETGKTENGVNWCHFTVAVNRRTGKKDENGKPVDEAEYIRVTAWYALGDSCSQYLRKGRKVCVVGESKARGWIGEDGKPRAQIELLAKSVEFLGGRNDGSGNPAPTDEDAPPMPRDAQSGMTQVDPEDQPW